MNEELNILTLETIENRIFTIRGVQVMLDSHLAEMYQVEIKVLNQAVKRNIERFPEGFRFELSENEWKILRSQFVTLKSGLTLTAQTETTKDKRGKHWK